MPGTMCVVLSTFANLEDARRVGRALVEERMAACVNVLPGVESIYRWEGRVESGSEVLVLLKTTQGQYPALEKRLRELHPYEVPEIVALPTQGVLAAYDTWVGGAVGGV